MTALPLGDLLRNRETMMRLYMLAFWSSIVIMAIGFFYIIRELFG